MLTSAPGVPMGSLRSQLPAFHQSSLGNWPTLDPSLQKQAGPTPLNELHATPAPTIIFPPSVFLGSFYIKASAPLPPRNGETSVASCSQVVGGDCPLGSVQGKLGVTLVGSRHCELDVARSSWSAGAFSPRTPQPGAWQIYTTQVDQDLKQTVPAAACHPPPTASGPTANFNKINNSPQAFPCLQRDACQLGK